MAYTPITSRLLRGNILLWNHATNQMVFDISQILPLVPARCLLVPDQQVLRVGHLAHKLLAEALGVDGREARVVNLCES